VADQCAVTGDVELRLPETSGIGGVDAVGEIAPALAAVTAVIDLDLHLMRRGVLPHGARPEHGSGGKIADRAGKLIESAAAEAAGELRIGDGVERREGLAVVNARVDVDLVAAAGECGDAGEDPAVVGAMFEADEPSLHSGLAAERSTGLTVYRERRQENYREQESESKCRRCGHLPARWSSGRTGLYGGVHTGSFSK
jgi:hypothetical protein